MVTTVKFSQFTEASLSDSSTEFVGLSSGVNVKSPKTPSWITSTRPSPAFAGIIGYNSQTSLYEFYNGSAWVSLTTSSSGGLVNNGLVNQLAYYEATGNAVSGLSTSNNGVLITSSLGVPSISSTLPSAVQTNITAVATNAITNAMAAKMPAFTLKGNNTGLLANAMDLSVAQVLLMLGVIGSLNVQKFTSNGTYTPTPGTVFAIAEGIGSGGSGAGTGNSANLSIVGAGSAGTYSRRLLTAVQIGASQAVTIGAAVAGGAAGPNNGNNGNTTSLGALLTCPGGLAGTTTTSGGPGSVGTGDISVPGNGGQGTAGNQTSPLINIAGSMGGVGFWGGQAATGQGNGVAPSGYGCGGNGAQCFFNNGAAAGASSGAGFLIITEFIAA